MLNYSSKSEIKMDKELESRLIKIEHALINKNYSDFTQLKQDDEIDLRELWQVIWAGKLKITAITLVFAIASVFYALSLPNMYKSSMLLTPSQNDAKGGLSALAAQYGGLAAMAGINLGGLGGDNGRIEQAVELMTSWPFLESFVNKYNIKPQIMALKGWDKKKKQLVYDDDIYNPRTKMWVREVDIDKGETSEPSSYETFEKFSKMLSVNIDSKSGMISLSVEHYSPEIAFDWVGLLKEEINSFYQEKDMLEAQNNIDYLEKKIHQTNVTDMQSVFYKMIEGQMKTLMLAEVSEQYLIKTVVPAKVAEEKSKPRRLLIVLLTIMLGGIVSTIAILVSYLLKK